VVDRLSEQGLVARGEDPADRRATRVVLTAAGRRLVARLYRFRRALLERLLRHLDLDALTMAAQTFARLAAAAAAEAEADEPAVAEPEEVKPAAAATTETAFAR
jgi:MarR family transcriptional regulator for hemolysin